MLNYDELEKAYEAASRGSEAPDVISVYCEVCRRGFVLTAGHAEVCEHLQERIKAAKLAPTAGDTEAQHG